MGKHSYYEEIKSRLEVLKNMPPDILLKQLFETDIDDVIPQEEYALNEDYFKQYKRTEDESIAFYSTLFGYYLELNYELEKECRYLLNEINRERDNDIYLNTLYEKELAIKKQYQECFHREQLLESFHKTSDVKLIAELLVLGLSKDIYNRLYGELLNNNNELFNKTISALEFNKLLAELAKNKYNLLMNDIARLKEIDSKVKTK